MKKPMRITHLTWIILLLCSGLTNLYGKQIYSCCNGELPDMPRIYATTDVRNEKAASFSVGDFMVIHVRDLDTLLAHQKDGLCLWINGICFPNVKVLEIDHSCKRVYVQLERDTHRLSPWHILYSYDYYFVNSKLAAIAIGTHDRVLTSCWPVAISTSERWMIGLGWLMIIGLVLLTFYLAKRMLRDTSPLAQVKDYTLYFKKKDERTRGENEIYFYDIPYSLGRSQLLFWNVLVVFAIIYVWMFTDNLVSPSGTVLIIIGISGGTNLISRIIDKDQNSKQADDITKQNTAPGVAAPKEIVAKDFYNEGYRSKGFMRDLMSDGNSISIHRFQLVVFTLVMGIYFLWYVIYNLSMPQFSDTMLLLMGISSTTYAGVKITEK